MALSQQRSRICIDRHVGAHDFALQHGGQNKKRADILLNVW